MKAAGAEEVIFEYEHGDAKVKKNLELPLDSAETGDTIISPEVSRLSRKPTTKDDIPTVFYKHYLVFILL